MIKLKNVSKSYGKDKLIHKVFEKMNFTFESNKSYSLVGPSGSGKTTFLNIISGLDDFNGGSIKILAQELYGHQGHGPRQAGRPRPRRVEAEVGGAGRWGRAQALPRRLAPRTRAGDVWSRVVTSAARIEVAAIRSVRRKKGGVSEASAAAHAAYRAVGSKQRGEGITAKDTSELGSV